MNRENYRDIFRGTIAGVVARFLAQNQFAPVDEMTLGALADALVSMGEEIRRVVGAPMAGELPDDIVKEGVASVLAVFSPPRSELAGLVKQLIKGCYQPDHPQCRESYHETDAHGRCRRQELAYDLTRVSGAHCVDCPHWRGWTPDDHAARLAAEWKAGSAVFLAQREVFLPEDFRALRLFTRSHA